VRNLAITQDANSELPRPEPQLLQQRRWKSVQGLGHGRAETGVKLSFGRQTADAVRRLQYQYALPGAGQQGGANQAVVAGADHQGVIVTHSNAIAV